ncbi:MAG TPA: tyrosine-type recombinase/integrase [Herpetosiphonaceae bacterium]
MGAGKTLEVALETWLADLAERRLSERTIITYRSALAQFRQWVETQPETIELATLHLRTFQDFIDSLKARRLHHHTILDYIGVLTRWLQDLVHDGELPQGVPNDRGKHLQPAGVRDRLERMVERRNPPVAPRIPDLRDLPNYYPDCLAAFLAQRGGAPPASDDARAFREYLSLLRNQALIGALFASGGRISEVLSLKTAQVRHLGTIPDAVQITGKGRKQRPLRLDEDARRWIGQYLRVRAHHPLAKIQSAEYLFISHGPRGAGAQLTSVTGWRVVKAAADALADAQVADGAAPREVRALRAVSPHAIRHYVAQYMLEEGGLAYQDIAAIFGHSSAIVTEQVYARLSDERTLELADTAAPRRRKPR